MRDSGTGEREQGKGQERDRRIVSEGERRREGNEGTDQGGSRGAERARRRRRLRGAGRRRARRARRAQRHLLHGRGGRGREKDKEVGEREGLLGRGALTDESLPSTSLDVYLNPGATWVSPGGEGGRNRAANRLRVEGPTWCQFWKSGARPGHVGVGRRRGNRSRPAAYSASRIARDLRSGRSGGNRGEDVRIAVERPLQPFPCICAGESRTSGDSREGRGL